MTTYESTNGSIVHVELYTDDLDATEAFFGEAFGWEFEPVEGMDYTIWRAPDPPSGGIVVREEGPFTPPPTLFYVDVEDLAATREAISEAGGEILVEELDVPEMGVFAVFCDPGGVVEAAWEDRYDGEPPEGGWPQFTDEPDAGSIVHFELYSEDPAATRAFHEAVFGWEFETIGEGGYTMVEPPTPPFGGVLEANEEMPNGTLVYLLVEDAGDASEAVETAGGRVLREPYEVPGWGTMAVFEAPGGVVGAVWESAPESAEPRSEPEAAGTPGS